ncbi:MAG: hypothetical protein Q8R18_02285 [bacterium]|nr:hypothetical protein [bacterium]
MVKKRKNFSGYTATLPLVALLTTTCIPERDFARHIDSEKNSMNYVCQIDTSSHNVLPDDGKTFSLSFDNDSWSLKGYKDIMDYAQSLHPGMSVTVRAYAHTPQGITESYAKKRIESVSLFLQRGNGALDFVPEIVYDRKANAQKIVEIIPQKSRVHEALDNMVGDYDTVLVEHSAAMQKDGLWAALQAYDFAGKTVSLVTGLSPDCGRSLKDIQALGRSVIIEGLSSYLDQEQGRTLIISAGLSEDLTGILKKHPYVAVFSPETLEGDGLADAGDTGRTKKYRNNY